MPSDMHRRGEAMLFAWSHIAWDPLTNKNKASFNLKISWREAREGQYNFLSYRGNEGEECCYS